MKNTPSSILLPTRAKDADDLRIAIDRLESEAPTHNLCPDDERKRPVAPSRIQTKMDIMKTTAGLWIDHRKAVIAIVSADGEETLEIQSHVEKQPGRLEGVRSTAPFEARQVPSDHSREREFTGQLHRYYDVVIAAIRGAESILIFGPGEAKGELKKRLEHAKLGDHIIAVQTTDKMTDRQVAAKVREYFHK